MGRECLGHGASALDFVQYRHPGLYASHPVGYLHRHLLLYFGKLTSKICLKVLKVDSASQLGEIITSVGLAQNLAALRALVSEGIQEGHMKLHAKNIAISAGATGELIEKVSEIMVQEKNVKFLRAKELIEKLEK